MPLAYYITGGHLCPNLCPKLREVIVDEIEKLDDNEKENLKGS